MRPSAQPPLSARVIHLGAKKRAAAFAMGLGATMLRAAAAFRRFNPRTVLVLEPFGMGDMISHQPLIRSLLENGYDVRVCARPEWRSLYPEIERWVPARIPWSSYAEGTKYSVAEYLKQEFREFLGQLREAGHGCVGVDTRGDIRSIILLYLAGCRRVVTLSNYLGSDLDNLPGVAERVSFRPEARRWEMNLEFLGALGVQGKGGPPRFPHLSRVRAGISERQLGLIPIAPWNGKWWDREKWSELIANIPAKGWRATALCGPGQGKVVAQELPAGVEIVECSSMEQWGVELQKCSVVVTVDTGGMHLADALEVPVIALFGQGLLPLWAPSGTQSRVLSHQDAPDFALCHQIENNTPLGREFMGRIQAAEVVAALDQLDSARRVN